MIELDSMDRKILRVLQDDAGLKATEVAKQVGLSQPATWRRIARMQKEGVILGQRLVLDAQKAGFGVVVFLGIKLATKGRVAISDFERAVSAIPEVLLIQHVLGLYDYRVKVVARDIADFERILRRRIMEMPGVGNVEANVLLSEEIRPILI